MKWDNIILSKIIQKDKYILSLIYRIRIKYKYIWNELEEKELLELGADGKD